jgi:hypothetical protein
MVEGLRCVASTPGDFVASGGKIENAASSKAAHGRLMSLRAGFPAYLVSWVIASLSGLGIKKAEYCCHSA